MEKERQTIKMSKIIEICFWIALVLLVLLCFTGSNNPLHAGVTLFQLIFVFIINSVNTKNE